MQLFIGGACAGKRDLVAGRYPNALWLAVNETGPGHWRDRLGPGRTLVLTGWAEWLAQALGDEPDDDRLRARLAAELSAMAKAERETHGQLVLILPEMGRGIVPLDPADRRLRDLAGWLAQDAAARAGETWYVRHGLARCLSRVKPSGNSR